MPNASPQSFIQALGSAISCVSPQRLNVSTRRQPVGEEYVAEFPQPVSLRSSPGGPSGLFFDVTYVFSVTGDRQGQARSQARLSTRMHQYRLLDDGHRELLVYHWQPGTEFQGPDHPHLHVSAALEAQVDAVTRREIGLDKLHVATGQVSLAAIVRMLITEFGIAPLRHDWRATLDRTEADLNAALNAR